MYDDPEENRRAMERKEIDTNQREEMQKFFNKIGRRKQNGAK